jgi:hypothetical protein
MAVRLSALRAGPAIFSIRMKTEQHTNLKFCVKLKKENKDIISSLEETHFAENGKKQE